MTVAFPDDRRGVPLELGARVTHVAIEFWAENKSGKVSEVHVYNGGTRVATFEGPWTGPRLLLLPLDNAVQINRGLGISINTQTRDPYNTRFSFSLVAALVE